MNKIPIRFITTSEFLIASFNSEKLLDPNLIVQLNLVSLGFLNILLKGISCSYYAPIVFLGHISG